MFIKLMKQLVGIFVSESIIKFKFDMLLIVTFSLFPLLLIAEFFGRWIYPWFEMESAVFLPIFIFS